MKIIIDADACPKEALQYAIKTGRKNGIEVVTVASFNHNIESDRHITVGNASQEADIKVINITEAGDIVITQDWGLAAVILAKKAAAMAPSGTEYRQDKIDFMLEEREIKAKFRRGGGRTKGPSKRTEEDEKKFRDTLDRITARQVSSFKESEKPLNFEEKSV